MNEILIFLVKGNLTGKRIGTIFFSGSGIKPSTTSDTDPVNGNDTDPKHPDPQHRGHILILCTLLNQ